MYVCNTLYTIVAQYLKCMWKCIYKMYLKIDSNFVGKNEVILVGQLTSILAMQKLADKCSWMYLSRLGGPRSQHTPGLELLTVIEIMQFSHNYM